MRQHFEDKWEFGGRYHKAYINWSPVIIGALIGIIIALILTR